MVTSEDKKRNSASKNQSMADRDQNPADVVSVDLPAPAGWMKKSDKLVFGMIIQNEKGDIPFSYAGTLGVADAITAEIFAPLHGIRLAFVSCFDMVVEGDRQQSYFGVVKADPLGDFFPNGGDLDICNYFATDWNHVLQSANSEVDRLAQEGIHHRDIVFIPRKWGTPKRNEIVFISPTGEEIKSKRQLDQYLRSHPGGPSSSDFDWGTGDTPRRSARISEKLKASETPEHEPPKKRQRKSSLKESKEKNDGEEDQEMTGKEDKDVEGQSETLEKEKEYETEAPQEGKKDGAKTVKPTEEAFEKEKEDETEAPQEGKKDGAETVKPTEEALEKEKEDETEAPQEGKKDGAETVEPTEERSSSNVVTENLVEEKKDEETHAQEEPTAVASVDEEMKDVKERDDEVKGEEAVPSEEGAGLKDAADGETKQQNQNMAENLGNNEQEMVAKEDNSNEKQSGELKEEKEQPESEVMVEVNAQGGPEVKEDQPKENSGHGDIESKPSHQSSISCEDGKHPPKASPVSC